MLSPDAELGPELAEALERLDELVEAFESDPDPGIRELATELLQTVDQIHRPGVTRLAGYLAESAGPARERALADPVVRLLLELYDLLPERPGFISLDEIEVSSEPRA